MADRSPSPKEIYEGCCRGDDSAWDLVFRLCVQRGQRTGLGDSVRDIAQDVVVKLINGSIHRVDNPNAFNAFVRRMMDFEIINHVRGRREEPHPDPAAGDATSDPLPEDLISMREVRQSIWDILADLGPRCRQVLRLRFSGRKHREIADLLGIPLNTVSTQLRRCLESFRKHPGYETIREAWS